MKRMQRIFLAAGLLGFCSLVPAQGQDCETVANNLIENCGFEADAVASPPNLVFGTPTGWFGTGPTSVQWGYANLDETFFIGKTGDNTAFINPVGGGSTANIMCQRISESMIEGDVYYLQGDMCRRFGYFEPVNYWIALRDQPNDILVAEQAHPEEGECLPVEPMTYTVRPTDAGGILKVCISVIATPTDPAQVHFDNLIATVNEPPQTSGVILADGFESGDLSAWTSTSP